VIVVSDRGTVSEGNLELFSELGLSYIVGVRMRWVWEVGEEILSRPGRWRKVAEKLKVKEVCHQGKRYIVCLNEEEAERERKAREEMVKKLREKLARGGLKALVGNRGWRKYLRVSGAKAEIDERALKREARYDGKYVLLTDCDLPAEEVASAYKGLWRVEAAFREPQMPLRVTRDASRVLGPIYHWTEVRVRGHVMVCFLAFILRQHLRLKLKGMGWEGSFIELLEALKRVRAVEIEDGAGLKYRFRDEIPAEAMPAFRAV